MFIKCVDLRVLQVFICLFLCVDLWWCVRVSLFCVCVHVWARSIKFNYRIWEIIFSKSQNVGLFSLPISHGAFQGVLYWNFSVNFGGSCFFIHGRTKSSFVSKSSDFNLVSSYRDHSEVAKLSDDLFVFLLYFLVTWEGSFHNSSIRLVYFLFSWCCECLAS